MEFKKSMRVKHVSHGKGIVVDVDKLDLDSITVEFDVEPEGWGNPLRVSKSCSKIMMKCTACGNECFEDVIYPQAVFWDDKKCICEECSIDFEEVDGVIQFRQDLIEDGCVEPVSIPKIEIDVESVKKISDKLIADYDTENQELTIEHSDKIEELDKKHQDWINKGRK